MARVSPPEEKQRSRMMSKALVMIAIVVVAGVVVWSLSVPTSVNAQRKPAAQFTAGGDLIYPEGYREWVFIGAPITPNDMNGGHAAFPEFHDVYIDRPAFAEYQKTGAFPEGTVMVKELVSVGSKKAPSGNGYFPGKFNGISASVKDTQRFGGDRFGWGYFNFGASTEPAKVQPAAACNACHKASAAEDMTFVQYYPVLEAARAKAKAMGSPSREMMAESDKTQNRWDY
jgi:hypothetical protein